MLYAYSYAVQPDKNKKEYFSGWTKARDKNDVIEKLLLRFDGINETQISVSTYNEPWESFISINEYDGYHGGE